MTRDLLRFIDCKMFHQDYIVSTINNNKSYYKIKHRIFLFCNLDRFIAENHLKLNLSNLLL